MSPSDSQPRRRKPSAGAIGQPERQSHPDPIGSVLVRPDRRSRRLTLRLDAASGEARLSVPPGISREVVRRFLDDQRDWIAHRRRQLPRPVPFADGAVLPVLGRQRTIRHRAERGCPAELCGELLVVRGPEGGIGQRVENLLRSLAREVLSSRAREMAGRLGVTPASVAVRDQKSRWGSCSSARRLNFSWRLVLAPPRILEYVVAHEVAHLREMNHSADFWRLVDSLIGDHRPHRGWLREHGGGLMRYGVPEPAAARQQAPLRR